MTVIQDWRRRRFDPVRQWTMGPQNASPITYLLRDEFTTAAAAPLASPRACEPGPGTLTLVQTDGQFSIVGGALVFPAQATPAWGDQGFTGDAQARVAGRALLASLNLSTWEECGIGWHTAAAVVDPDAMQHALQAHTTDGRLDINGDVQIASGLSTGTAYPLAIVQFATGAGAWLQIGGVWQLRWVWLAGAGDPLYPAFANLDGAGGIDYVRVRDTTLTDMDALAVVDVAAFTQAWGPELLVNGNFAAWTGDNPDGWTVTGEVGADPEVTERDPDQGHADVVTVGGAANFYSSVTAFAPTITQNVAIVNRWHEFGLTVTARAGGEIQMICLAGGLNVYGASVTAMRALGRFAGTDTTIRPRNVIPIDFTIDDATLKRITLNAQQTGVADAINDFEFTLSGAPAAHDTVSLFYRISDADLEAGYNCWRAYLQRNATNTAWDARLDSVNAGTATNRIAVTGVGTPDTVRAIARGTKHNLYTIAAGVPFKRGAEVDVSHNDAATGVNTIYATGTTPTRLRVWPVTSAVYDELDVT